MKILPFKIPRTEDAFFFLQHDDEPYFYDTLHQHPEIQITLIQEGDGTAYIGGYIGEFEAGDVFVIGENVPHVFRNNEIYYQGIGLRARAMTLFLDKNVLIRSCFSYSISRELSDFFVRAKKGIKITDGSKLKIAEHLNVLNGLTGLNQLIQLLEVLKLLNKTVDYRILSNYTMDVDVQEVDGVRLNNVIQFTLSQFHRPIELEEVASVANMSSSAFCRFFKLRTRKTYTEFLNEVRINKACNHLAEKDATVFEVCYKVGFNNLSYFNRKFKRITGHTPSTFQKTMSTLEAD